MQLDRSSGWLFAATLSVVLACGGEDTPPPAGGGPANMVASCEADRRLGGFEVQYDADTRSVSGHIAERPAPTAPETLVKQSGDCRMLRRTNPFCDPPCGSGTICVTGGTCAAEPKNLNLGTVTITGLKKAVRMDPRPPSNEYFDSDLPEVLYDPGNEIRLEASGSGDVRGFALRSTGIPPLTVSTTDWSLGQGKGLPLSWSAANGGSTRVLVRVSVDQHGSSPVALTCDLPDNGKADLAASLVDELLGYGVSGYPSALITRRAVVATDVVNGCADLQILSVSNHTLKVAGHTPCKRTSDCPMGKTCDVAKESCR